MMYIYLDIFEKFSCLQCGACCRNNWLVTVDEAGYRRNRELFREAGREDEFQQAFIPLQSKADYGEYAQISKKPAGGCWFLTEQKLCRLQQLAGHEHLDAVCQWFPRYPMDSERGIELSLSFSCPAALELALREEPLRIVRSEKTPITLPIQDFVTHVYPRQQPANKALHYYFEIEGHLIDVLQSRQLLLPDRLAIIRQSMERLDRLTDRETMGKDINHLFQVNYERIDAAADSGGNESTGPAHWLIENYFVNFFFRKNLYNNGFDATLRQLGLMEGKLRRYLSGAGREDVVVVELSSLIVQMELEYNHNGRKMAK